MTDERQQGSEEDDRTPVDAGPVAFGEMLHLSEQLAARSSEVRGDAERALDRAVSLRAARDPRAGIAVSACREALSAYREAVDGSLRQACATPQQQEAAEPAGSPEPVGSPERAPSDPGPSTATVIRHKTARALAVAAVAGVLGLVGWGGLPSWSTVMATSSGQLADAPSAGPTAAGAPRPAAGADPRAGAERHAGSVGRSDDDRPARPAPQSRDVRRLLASTLRGAAAAPESPATVARALRAVGEAAASVASAGEALAPADAGSRRERDGTGSALPDPSDTLGEAAGAAGDRLPDGGGLGGEGMPDPRPSDRADDVDGLEPGPGERPELMEGAASDGDDQAADGAEAGGAETVRERDDPGMLGGDDRSTGSSAAGVSDDAELSR